METLEGKHFLSKDKPNSLENKVTLMVELPTETEGYKHIEPTFSLVCCWAKLTGDY
jgi:hypothetical protein